MLSEIKAEGECGKLDGDCHTWTRAGERRNVYIFAALTAALLLILLISVAVGRYVVSPQRVVAIVVSPFFSFDMLWTAMDERVVTLLRGPRALLAALCGAGLAMAGATMQAVLRNPLASPDLLGVSSGAALGGAVAILFGLSGMFLIGGAFTFGLFALVLVGAIARLGSRSNSTTVILAGVITGAFFAALVSLAQLLADPQNSLPAIVFWLMGSFATSTPDRLLLSAPIIAAASLILWAMRFRINVLSLGEEDARTMGVPVDRDRWLVFVAVATIVAATVAVAGIIGWIGIVVPHAARLLVGTDNRLVLPASALLGASYLCLADTLSRTISGAEIPVGILTAIIGAPGVALLLRNLQSRSENV